MSAKTCVFTAIFFIVLPLFSQAADVDYTYGLRPSYICSRDMGLAEFFKHANSARDIHDLVTALPKDKLKTYTYVYQSQSMQKDKVDFLWPRVIRISDDGRLSIAYVCNPQSKQFNTVEVLHFNDQEKVEAYHIDLRKKAGVQFQKTAGRITKNPSHVCSTCHAPNINEPNELRPIWGMYPTWPGVYGSVEDHLPSQFELFKDPAGQLKSERQMFNDFKALQKDNPCYGTLSDDPRAMAVGTNFPFSSEVRSPVFERRPNLRLTISYALLNAKRVTRKLREKPGFKKLAHQVLMEALSCSQQQVDAPLSTIVENGRKKNSLARAGRFLDVTPRFNPPVDSESKSGLLYFASLGMGLSSKDWTLEHNTEDPTYGTGVLAYATIIPTMGPISATTTCRTNNDVRECRVDKNLNAEFEALRYSFNGRYPDGDGLPMGYLIRSQLLLELAKENPVLKKYFYVASGVQDYGESFACLGKSGGTIVVTDKDEENDNTEALCAELQKGYDKVKNTPMVAASFAKTPTSQAVGGKIAMSPRESQGAELFKRDCARCHNSNNPETPLQLNFMASEKTLKLQLKTQSHTIDQLMMPVENGLMPADKVYGAGEIAAIKAYLNYWQNN